MQMKRFGEELKAARESKNISLQDISKATRINVKFIEAIEAGNHSILPQTYIRAFIKSYAKSVGLDQEETIARYEQYNIGKAPDTKAKVLKTEKSDDSENVAEPSQTEQPPKATEPAPKKADEVTPKTLVPETINNISENKHNALKEENDIVDYSRNNLQQEHVKYLETPKVNYFAIFLVIAVILALLLFIFRTPFKDTIEPERIPIDTIVKEIEGQQETEQTEQTETVPVAPIQEPPITQVSSDSLLLGILSETDVWVSIRMDRDGAADRGTITANNMKYVKAKERFTITAIRGRQIKIYLNNNFIGNLSQTDSLRTAVVTLSGIVYLKPSEPTTPPPRTDDTDLKPLEPVFR